MKRIISFSIENEEKKEDFFGKNGNMVDQNQNLINKKNEIKSNQERTADKFLLPNKFIKEVFYLNRKKRNLTIFHCFQAFQATQMILLSIPMKKINYK